MEYLDYLIGILGSVSQDDQTIRLLFIGIMGVAGIVLALAIFLLLRAVTNPLHRRVKVAATVGDEAVVHESKMAEALQPLGSIIRPKTQESASKVQKRLRAAGFRAENAVGILYGAKLILFLVLPAIVIVIAVMVGGLPAERVIIVAALMGMAGLMIPDMVLNSAIRRRTKKMRHGFPDALDMLVVCIEAGLGLRAAIARVADELVVSYPDLADELSLVNAEMRAGIDRVQALRNFAERTGVEEIRGFVAVLAQSMKFGTSIAETLRTYSHEFRDKRMMMAEELAEKIPGKMIFPMLLFIFPAIFVIGIGPAVIGAIRALQGS